MRFNGIEAQHRQAVAGGAIGNNADVVAEPRLFAGEVKHVAEQPANWRAHAMENAKLRRHVDALLPGP